MDGGDGTFKHEQVWVAGKPEFGFFGGVKVRGRTQFEVVTYRCPAGGLLESHGKCSAR